MYSDSMLDNTTIDCHFLAHDTAALFVMKTYPEVDLEVSGSPDQSASVYPWKSMSIDTSEPSYVSSRSFVACKYHRALLADSQWVPVGFALNQLSNPIV